MRLTRYTDYAMRALFYLAANEGKVVPISAIASAFAVSQNHMVKIVHNLVKAGYLSSVRGRNGGVRLARPADQINIGAVIRHTEPDMRLIDCVGCPINGSCALPRPLYEATAAFVAVLDRYTLADVVNDSPGLGRIIGLE